MPPIELKVETTTGINGYVKALWLVDNHDYLKLEKIIRSAIEESITELDLKRRIQQRGSEED